MFLNIDKENEYIVIDKLSFRVFIKALFLGKNLESIKIVLLPKRRAIHAWMIDRLIRKVSILNYFDIQKMWISILRVVCKSLKIIELSLDDYPTAKTDAGRIGVQITEELDKQWSKQHPFFVNAFRKTFFNNSDIDIARKKSMSQVVEDVFQKIFATNILLKSKKGVLILSDSENIFFKDIAKKQGLLELNLIKNIQFVETRNFLTTGFYLISSFVMNIVTIMFIFMSPLFGRISFARNKNKIAGQVACHNFSPTIRRKGKGPSIESKLLSDMCFLIDDVNFTMDDLVLLANRYGPSGEVNFLDNYKEAGLSKVLDIRKSKMPILEYLNFLKRSFVPTFCLYINSFKGLFSIIPSSFFTVLLYELIIWVRVCEQASFKAYLDFEEHSTGHIIKTIAFKKYGACSVFFPHGILQYISYLKAFLAYTYMLSAGDHFPLAYGKYWKQDMVMSKVGLPSNDKVSACNSTNHLNSEGFQRIVKGLKAQKKSIIAFFPTSVVSEDKVLFERYMRFMKLSTLIVDRFPNTVVLIKFKYGDSDYADVFKKGRSLEILDSYLKNKSVYFIDQTENLTCSIQSMSLIADACVSISGHSQSINAAWIEPLMLRRPTFAFDPDGSSPRTPLLEKFYGKLIFEKEEGILEELDKILVQKNWTMPCWELAQQYFDPFCDGKGLERVRKQLKQIIDRPSEFKQENQTINQFLAQSINAQKPVVQKL